MVSVLTAQDLRDGEACPPQIALFVATFGEYAYLEPANVRKAIAAGLFVCWPDHTLGVFFDEDLEQQCPGYSKRHSLVVDELYHKYSGADFDTLQRRWWKSRDLAESVIVSDKMVGRIIEAWEDWLHAGCPGSSY